MHAGVAQKRKWRRYLQRAEDVGIAARDTWVLLGGIEKLTARVLEATVDVKVRAALTKNELQLHSRPDYNGELRSHSAIWAELQTTAPMCGTATLPSTGAESAKLKNINAAGDEAGGLSPSSPQPMLKATVPCKFCLTDAGCIKGSSCSFSHN